MIQAIFIFILEQLVFFLTCLHALTYLPYRIARSLRLRWLQILTAIVARMIEQSKNTSPPTIPPEETKILVLPSARI